MKETRFRLKNQIIDKLNKKDFNNLDLLIIDYFTECLVEKYSPVTIHKDEKTIEFKLTRDNKKYNVETISNKVTLCLRIEQNDKIQNQNNVELYELREGINIWITFLFPDNQFNVSYITLDMLLMDHFDLLKYIELKYEGLLNSVKK